MPAKPSLTHHAINYIELTVIDMDRAKRFYSDAFDWSFNDYGPTYAGIRKTDGPGEAGGLRLDERAPTTGPGAPLIILFSMDLDATVQSVRDAGGRITTDPFDFPGGRRFHFTDSEGNELAVWAE